MNAMPDIDLDHRLRSRAVFVCSRGSRLFLGRTPESHEREVTMEQVESLISAGFEIVEINMRDGAPLCTALARVPADEPRSDPGAWPSRAALTCLEPPTLSVVELPEGTRHTTAT